MEGGQKNAEAKTNPVKSEFRDPGWKSLKSTSLFRAVNPELFIRPNKIIMGIGLVLITSCVAYLGYMQATTDNRKSYMALNEKDELEKRPRSSRWD